MMNAAVDFQRDTYDNIILDDNLQSIDLISIRNFLLRFRCEDRIFIPSDNLDELQKLFETKARLSLNLSQSNPLSTMETIVLALSLILSTKHIACVLMSTSGTVESYVKRARLKLHAKTKIFALFRAVKHGYVQIMQ